MNKSTLVFAAVTALGCGDELPAGGDPETGTTWQPAGSESGDASPSDTTGAGTSADSGQGSSDTADEPDPTGTDTGTDTDTDTGEPPSSADGAYYGVPWTGDGIGELRIRGQDYYSVSLLMPYEGEVDQIRQYFIGVGDCTYGCGDGGQIELRIHRDADGIPGEEVAAVMLTPQQVASVRDNDDVFFPVDFDPFTVGQGERIWMVVSNHHPDPDNNYISLDPFHLHSRWADPELPGPVSSVDPQDRLWTVYDAELELIPWKHHILAAYYVDGRVAGNGYVMCSPHCSYGSDLDKWAVVGGDARVRQRFTPSEALTFERVDFRLLLASGSDPLEITIRQGGEVVATGSAADWVPGGWGYPVGPEDPYGYGNDLDAQLNAQWGSVPLPLTTLEAGVEAEVEITAAAGTEYHAVGREYGADHLPGAYHDWPEAEKTDGGRWVGFDERDNIDTGHLNFFFPLVGR